jgi:outer membrane immunogenic protein
VPAIGAIPSRLFAFEGRDGSFTGGFQAGYNWQFAPNWLVGIEGDINYLRGERSNNFRFTVPGEDVVGNINTNCAGFPRCAGDWVTLGPARWSMRPAAWHLAV